MSSPVIEFIRLQPLFDVLTESELAKVEQAVEIKEYPAGSQIIKMDGHPSKFLYIIYQGAVRLVRDGQTVQVLEDGEYFGYSSLISQKSPVLSVIADEDSQMYQIPEAVFNRLIENDRFAKLFMQNLGDRLRQFTMPQTPHFTGELSAPISNLVIRPLVTISPAATVAEAARVMRRAWVDAVLVTDQPPGIVTDHDFQVKVLAEELGPDTLVTQIMTRPLKTQPEDTPIYGTLLFMLEENIHHLPLTEDGEIIAIVTASDLLRYQARSPLYIMRHLETLESPETLARYSTEIAAMVNNLYQGGLSIEHIGRIIASVNDVLIRRLLRMAEDELGPPPTPYSWIVFGSEGRREQLLLTDQDNALIYKEDSAEARDYFDRLSKHVVEHLIKAGFPPCPGGYMAKNWHKPLSEWEALFTKWLTEPKPQALLESGIFFDFRPVHGQLSVEPLLKLIKNSGKQGIFLAHMARAAIEFKPPLGFFRRIRAEDGQVDIKEGGVAPIVSLARVYALEAQSRARTTFERLSDAAEAGTLSQEGAETLAETYRFLLQLRLEHQLTAMEAGQKPTNKIRLNSISAVENKHLKDAFLAIREMQSAVTQRFNTNMLG